MASTLLLIFIPSSLFSRSLGSGSIPRVPTTIGITVIFMIHSFFQPSNKFHSLSDGLMSYLGHLLEGSYSSAEMQSVYSIAPGDWTVDYFVLQFNRDSVSLLRFPLLSHVQIISCTIFLIYVFVNLLLLHWSFSHQR